MKNDDMNPQNCPCNSGRSYSTCCQSYIEQNTDAPTAVALMRSRYTAFTRQDKGYLRYSWHPDTCPINIRLNEKTRWLGLKIKHTVAGDINDENGIVEFVARYKINGKACLLHEISRFTRENTRWLYIDGKINEKTG